MKCHHPTTYNGFKSAQAEQKRLKISSVTSTVNKESKPLVGVLDFIQRGKPFSPDHPKQVAITHKIAKMVCHDLQPLDIVTDKGFRDLVHVAEPRYVFPSRKSLTNKIIPQLYDERRTSIHAELSGSNTLSLALTTDGWTSCTNQSYISFTGHVVDEHFNLKEYCLHVAECGESHTAVNLSRLIKKTAKIWTTSGDITIAQPAGISEDMSKWDSAPIPTIPIYVVTDNAANVTAAVKKHTSFEHVPCFGHTVQLCVNDGMSKFQQFKCVFDKAKAITTHFRHSAIETKKLNAMETNFGLKQLKLKQECPTRWNSRYHMLERLLTVREPVSAILANQTKIANLLPAEWDTAKNIVSVLRPFEQVTSMMSGAKYPTISMIIPILNELKQSLFRLVVDGAPEEIGAFCHTLVDNIDQRWPAYEHSPLFAASTMIDPRYKDCAFLDTDAAVLARAHVVNYGKKIRSPTIAALTTVEGT